MNVNLIIQAVDNDHKIVLHLAANDQSEKHFQDQTLKCKKSYHGSR